MSVADGKSGQSEGESRGKGACMREERERWNANASRASEIQTIMDVYARVAFYGGRAGLRRGSPSVKMLHIMLQLLALGSALLLGCRFSISARQSSKTLATKEICVV